MSEQATHSREMAVPDQGAVPVPEARVGHYRVYLDPDPDPDGGPVSWVVEDTRDGAAESDWFTYADAITEAMRLDREAGDT